MVHFSSRASARHVLAAAACAASLVGPAAAAEPIFPPAVSTGLVPPPGMTLSAGFAGFEHRSGASVVIAEMPAEAYALVADKLTPEAMQPTGFQASGVAEPLAVSGGEGRIFRGRQSSRGVAYAKWVALVKGPSGTALVTVQVPEEAEKEVPAAAVEATLRSIAFRTPASLADQIAALPYVVGDMAGLRPARIFAGSSLVLTEGPKDIDPDGSQPSVIVAPSLGQAPVTPGREAAMARRVAESLPQMKDFAVTREDRTVSGSAVVVTLRATATDAKTGRSMVVGQTMRFDDDRYLRVVTLAPIDRSDVLDRAERVAASLRVR